MDASSPSPGSLAALLSIIMPTILQPTDAIISMSATCVCGSDLWPHRVLQPSDGPTPMGDKR